MFENYIKEPFFSDEDRENYSKYKNLVGDSLKDIAKRYMNRELPMLEALDLIHALDIPGVGDYTRDLFFVFECTPIIEKIYEKEGLDKEIFKFFLQDIKYKLDECLRVKNVFGTFVVTWYNVFFEFRRVPLGRLQFDMAKYEEDPIRVGEYTLEKGDFFLRCHIPSGGPLKPELCKESLDRAYALFADRLHNGILPITCRSWLLYPGYRDVFGENSNTVKFAENFEIHTTREFEEFEDAWRVFGTENIEKLSELPKDTALQRNFIEYIKSGKPFGDGAGILLYDGKRILTAR